jgi:xanthine phosphoribosyltransferase
VDTATPYENVFPVTWNQLQRLCRELAGRLAGQEWKGILAVTRGGLVPAAIMARELDIHLIDTVCVSSYDWQIKGEPAELKRPEGDGEGWLMVDDLVDTGSTAKLLRQWFPKARFVTVFAKPKGRPLVDDCVAEVEQDTWVLFPWDAAQQFVPPIAKTRE